MLVVTPVRTVTGMLVRGPRGMMRVTGMAGLMRSMRVLFLLRSHCGSSSSCDHTIYPLGVCQPLLVAQPASVDPRQLSLVMHHA